MSVLGWFASIATALVAWWLGLLSWRYQHRQKRRTELAEEALLAFGRAVDALNEVRDASSSSAEHAEMRKDVGADAETRMEGEDGRIILWRLSKIADRFTDLRRLQLLCRYHFGERADRAFDDLREARHKVWVGARMFVSHAHNGDPAPTAESIKFRRQWEGRMWKGVEDPDEVAEKVAAAQRALEEALVPELMADAALVPSWLSPQRGVEWLNSARVRLRRANGEAKR